MKCFAVFNGIGIFAFLLRSCERTDWPALHCMTISKGLRLSICFWGWSGVRWCRVNFQCRGVLQIDKSRARAYCACSRCGWAVIRTFLSPLSFLFSFSLSLDDTLTSQPVDFSLTFQLCADLKLCNSCYCSRL